MVVVIAVMIMMVMLAVMMVALGMGGFRWLSLFEREQGQLFRSLAMMMMAGLMVIVIMVCVSDPHVVVDIGQIIHALTNDCSRLAEQHTQQIGLLVMRWTQTRMPTQLTAKRDRRQQW